MRSTQDLALRIVEQHRRAVGDELRSALAAFRDPAEGSPRARDLEWAAGGTVDRRDCLSGLWEAALGEVVELLRVADEHAAGLAVLLGNDELLPIPMLSLGRSIQEALLEVCWAVDPALEPAARTSRWAALLLRTIQGNVGPLSQVPNGTEKLAEVREAMTGMQALLTNAQFDLKFDKKHPEFVSSVAYERSARAALKINITEAAERYMPGVEYMWTLGSGATHSRNWFTGGLEGPVDVFYIMIVAPLLDFTDAAIDLTHGLVGLSSTNFHNRAHLRRTALFQRRPDRDPRLMQASYSEYAAARQKRL
ncbi:MULTISPECIES: hypothetical protein [unclassified Gordonia (in: high G+C Gram-positive bacteria)]|uniref:hypothetical protein n=1 Tax=unclassified Gordonia (in: high G+C Gram-positive bacteria) TaxID=2657482 RepID=UPI001966A9DA|nr:MULTISPECIES: hypothetical protein [unclassified Gordonia (in: high G+C Gram-positive bacteria)]MBN0975107.1 hypothetical protein [Gordonia sp. BP-119]MBN0985280.1 hypothetical protein [Gordonia sp. BP-94]